MKDSHIYKRMSNPQVIKGYCRMIREDDIVIVEELFNNITAQADDHPNYETIYQVYQQRLGNDYKE